MLNAIKKQRIVDYINSCNVDEKIAIHNAYCKSRNRMDGCIYELDKLEKVLYNVNKWEFLNMIRFGNFDFLKNFWGFNQYGNLESYNAQEIPIFESDIANYILTSGDSLNSAGIQAILDEEEEG